MTSKKPRIHNLQIQINRECTLSTFKRLKNEAPTVVFLLVSRDDPPTAAELKKSLVKNICVNSQKTLK